ncbi:MAG: LuxR C-terminal-related transcriptional regulator [Bacteroidales bacterium]
MDKLFDNLQINISDFIKDLDNINDFPISVFVNEIIVERSTTQIKNIWGNELFYNRLNYTKNELNDIGIQLVDELIHPDDRNIVFDYLVSLKNIDSNNFFCGILRLRPKDACYNWYLITCWKLKNENSTNKLLMGYAYSLSECLLPEKQIFEFAKQLLQHGSQFKFNCITKREKQILSLIAKGMTNLEISHTLNISDKTTETHRKNIQRKLNLHNTAALVNFAFENGLN